MYIENNSYTKANIVRNKSSVPRSSPTLFDYIGDDVELVDGKAVAKLPGENTLQKNRDVLEMSEREREKRCGYNDIIKQPRKESHNNCENYYKNILRKRGFVWDDGIMRILRLCDLNDDGTAHDPL